MKSIDKLNRENIIVTVTIINRLSNSLFFFIVILMFFLSLFSYMSSLLYWNIDTLLAILNKNSRQLRKSLKEISLSAKQRGLCGEILDQSSK